MARPLVSPLIAYRQTANRTGPPAGNSREILLRNHSADSLSNKKLIAEWAAGLATICEC